MSSIYDEAQTLADGHGGTWSSHPGWPLEDWRYAVQNDDTRLGYWEWIVDEMRAEEG
ncbi:Uncharacterised protein (plasmid) [Tsukamurella tyrosinosolvens]|uniref:Uncharacterized protein n=1 Tax=Tsukamurella tyrosinosolvens TaxID=57704 RepID=A0A1H4V4U6_TSUTY|nr:hypothetical protein [Tsukamurella tyrosinosolvens]SEC75870.1 hypothetical protein SAMN04489793_3138 [Tsukamurella tyrosinosolvens]VEH90688.1 Uncharacterised protein [Tsukamurella tyrosinosolvens]